MQTTQLESESLNNKPIRFKLNDQGKSGVLHAFRTSERVRVTILTEFRVSPDKFRHTFLLLNPCHLEKIEQDPENNGGFVLREPLRTESQGMSGNWLAIVASGFPSEWGAALVTHWENYVVCVISEARWARVMEDRALVGCTDPDPDRERLSDRDPLPDSNAFGGRPSRPRRQARGPFRSQDFFHRKDVVSLTSQRRATSAWE